MSTPRKPCCRVAAVRVFLTLAGAGAWLLWAYWPTLANMAERWASDPQYSHGFLVPVFALVILWGRRDRLQVEQLAPSWWGLAFLLCGLFLWLGGAQIYLESVEAFSLLPTLAGLCLLVGGWAALRWAWPAIVFLGFMLPLPFQVDQFLAKPLRRVATACSTYLLQLFGFPALAEGNVILIGELRLGVVEACSGLGMLVAFFALATAVALVIRRRAADRVVVVVSAVPIALIANILRITAMAAAHATLGATAANGWLHDVSGWLMMPLALGLLWLELWYLDRLFLPAEAPRPLPLDLTGKATSLLYPRRQGNGPIPVEPPVTARRAAGPAGP
jgi:exosortase